MPRLQLLTRFGWALVASALLGLAVGFASAFAVLKNGQLLGQTTYDYWFGNELAGSTAADPYTRGIVAMIGLLALSRDETIYFHRYKDHEGQRLREGCTYELQGGPLPARWWSITVYADDDFLPVNGENASSVDATQIVRDESGRWTVRLASDRAGAQNWIATRNAGAYSLSIRLYNPEARARDDASTIPFPKLLRLGCGEGRT